MVQKRLQLTLFVDPLISKPIETIRSAFNPGQYALIKSHVTLCREDELEPLEPIIQNLAQLLSAPIVLDFGTPVCFAEGKGVFMPALGDLSAFQGLREKILSGIIDSPRIQEPHITLIHPRNGTCTPQIFEQIEQVDLPRRIEFKRVSLIEQNLGEPWTTLRTFELKSV